MSRIKNSQFFLLFCKNIFEFVKRISCTDDRNPHNSNGCYNKRIAYSLNDFVCSRRFEGYCKTYHSSISLIKNRFPTTPIQKIGHTTHGNKSDNAGSNPSDLLKDWTHRAVITSPMAYVIPIHGCISNPPSHSVR